MSMGTLSADLILFLLYQWNLKILNLGWIVPQNSFQCKLLFEKPGVDLIHPRDGRTIEEVYG